jgi:hypothetical protein
MPELTARALSIEQSELQSFYGGLPQYDGDVFMAELAALPDTDEPEETNGAGTW